MFTILSAGTSFNYGLGLHFYGRKEKGYRYSYTLTPEEFEFNHSHSYHSLLANKFNTTSKTISSTGGLDILQTISEIKQIVNQDNDVKIVLLQLINPERDFFIYNDKIYKIDFNSYEEFNESKHKLIETIPVDIKDDFVKKLEQDLEEYILNEPKWKEEHTGYFIDKVNALDVYLKEKNVIFKVISYFHSYDSVIDKFNPNIFVKLKYNNTEYSNVYDLVMHNKLRIKDDLNDTTDDHPNFKGHEIVSENLYQNILKDSLYLYI
jgi:hypothetical protein